MFEYLDSQQVALFEGLTDLETEVDLTQMVAGFTFGDPSLVLHPGRALVPYAPAS